MTPPQQPSVRRTTWGRMPDGTAIDAWTLTNARGTRVTAITLGAIITAIETADRDGARDDIVLGFDSVESYLTVSPYMGAVVGRYGNRIAKARFSIDGQAYTLAANNGVNHLHGGTVGFDKRVWSARSF